MRTARALVRATYPGSRAIVRQRRGLASIDLRGSLFCEVREASALPLCGFYAAAIARVLQLYRRARRTRRWSSAGPRGRGAAARWRSPSAVPSAPQFEVPEHAA